MSFLAFDIETVPDPDVWKAPEIPPERIKVPKEKPTKNDLAFLRLVMKAVKAEESIHRDDLEKAFEIAQLSEDEQRHIEVLKPLVEALPPEEEEKDLFAPLVAHRPIAIGYVWLNDDFSVRSQGCAGVSHYGESEPALLTGWAQFMMQAGSPTLVSWNGRFFDVPVLELRSMRHGIAQPWYTAKHRYRYDYDHHLDLKDVMSNFRAERGFRLDEVGRLIGLPGKFGIDGSQVAAAYAEGRQAEIEAYCHGDAVMTAFILMRYFLVRGRLSAEDYRGAALGLYESSSNVSELAPFVERIDKSKLLFEDAG